jgi:hypothetical protein
MGINSNSSTANQYEFYNYSTAPQIGNFTANPQEIDNQYFDSNNSSGGLSLQGQAYLEDFFNTGYNNGINIQNELYLLNTHAGNGNATQQVSLAIQVAFQNYIQYLTCTNSTTGANGTPSGNCRNNTCADYSS